MTLEEELTAFYKQHNLPQNGGVNDKTFGVPLPFFTLILPNYGWRKEMLHIHDLEHILNKQNTSWKGEIFIASWEIATGFWKHFPVCIFPLWTMGYGILTHPKCVYKGFLKGRNDKGIADLKISKDELLSLDRIALKQLTEGLGNRKKILHLPMLAAWSLAGLFVFLSPFLFLSGSLWLLF